MTGNDGHHIRQWLESQDGRRALRQIAVSIRKRSDFKTLQTGFSGSASTFFGENAKDPVPEELISELCLFMLEKSHRMVEMLSGENSRLVGFLYIAFLNHLKEKVRQSNINMERSLYRRISRVFSQSNRIFTKRRKSGSAFSIAQGDNNILIPRLLEEDLQAIPFPLVEAGGLDIRIVNTKDNLVMLGIFFWEQVSAMWGQKPIWVGIFDFVQWLRLHVVMARPEKSDMECISLYPDASRGGAEFFDADQVRTWAGMFAGRLNEKEMAALVMTVEHGMTLAEIAGKLNLKSSSAARYHREGAYEKLRDFLRDRPWLSPEDLNRDALLLFQDTLMRICIENLKKSGWMPSLINRR